MHCFQNYQSSHLEATYFSQKLLRENLEYLNLLTLYQEH